MAILFILCYEMLKNQNQVWLSVALIVGDALVVDKVNNNSCVQVSHKDSILLSFQSTKVITIDNFIAQFSYDFSGHTCM